LVQFTEILRLSHRFSVGFSSTLVISFAILSTFISGFFGVVFSIIVGEITGATSLFFGSQAGISVFC